MTIADLIEQLRSQADGSSSVDFAAGLNSAAEKLAAWLISHEEWPTPYPE